MTIYNIDGRIVAPEEMIFAASSRAYRYGDGFFESMKFSGKRLLHADLHMARIQKSALLLKMELPAWLNTQELELRVQQTAETEGISHARVRCTILRDSGGLYTPLDQNVNIVLEIQKIDNAGYDWNETGIKLGAYKELTKNSNYLSMLKTTSSLTYVMAGIFNRENGFHDCVIFNENGRIAECISSNIFSVSGEFINTPPLSEYCVDGVMRKVVMNLATAYGYTISEQPMTEVSLNSADEIFLTSATRGIRWVGSFGAKTYKPTVSKVLADKLNSGLI